MTDPSLTALIMKNEGNTDKSLKNNTSIVTFEKNNFNTLKRIPRNYNCNEVLFELGINKALECFYRRKQLFNKEKKREESIRKV